MKFERRRRSKMENAIFLSCFGLIKNNKISNRLNWLSWEIVYTLVYHWKSYIQMQRNKHRNNLIAWMQRNLMPLSLLSSFSGCARHGRVSWWLICFCLFHLFVAFHLFLMDGLCTSKHFRTNVCVWFVVSFDFVIVNQKARRPFRNTCIHRSCHRINDATDLLLHFPRKPGICIAFSVPISTFETEQWQLG